MSNLSNRPYKYFFSLAIIVFVLAIVFGFWRATGNLQNAATTIQNSLSGFRYLRSLPQWELFLYIFINNSGIALAMIIFGFFFGLVPLYFLYSNGLIIGYVVALVSINVSPLAAAAGLVPHGIFEITGIVTAAGYGIWLGVVFAQSIRGKAKFGDAFRLAIRRYFSFVLPILLVAAFIETFITPLIMRAAS